LLTNKALSPKAARPRTKWHLL